MRKGLLDSEGIGSRGKVPTALCLKETMTQKLKNYPTVSQLISLFHLVFLQKHPMDNDFQLIKEIKAIKLIIQKVAKLEFFTQAHAPGPRCPPTGPKLLVRAFVPK